MLNVKRTFFLTREEVEQQKKILGIGNLDFTIPHFEMEDGSMMWGIERMAGGSTERYYKVA